MCQTGILQYLRDNREELKQYILERKTEKELAVIYGCSTATIILAKKELKLQTKDLLLDDPGNKKQFITNCEICNKESSKRVCSYCVEKRTNIALKEILVEKAGGKCNKCGYDKCIAALDFHHRNPEEKEINVASSANANIAQKLEEIKKCDLLCARCHRELHWEKGGSLDFSQKYRYNIDKTKENLLRKMGTRGGGKRH